MCAIPTTGRAAYDPDMMVTLLLYGYMMEQRSSRRIEAGCRTDAAHRVICGDVVPDHATIARFLIDHQDAIEGVFVEVLRLCAAAGQGPSGRAVQRGLLEPLGGRGDHRLAGGQKQAEVQHQVSLSTSSPLRSVVASGSRLPSMHHSPTTSVRVAESRRVGTDRARTWPTGSHRAPADAPATALRRRRRRHLRRAGVADGRHRACLRCACWRARRGRVTHRQGRCHGFVTTWCS